MSRATKSEGQAGTVWAPWWRPEQLSSLPLLQKSFYNLMTSDKKSEKFFKVLHDRMKKAQQETKSTVSVNMSDIGNKPREDKDEPDPGTKGTRPWPLGDPVSLSLGCPPLTRLSCSLGRGDTFLMPGTPSRYPMAMGFQKGHDTGEQGQNNEMGVTVLIMEPILRFLQLLCENHNRDLQVGYGDRWCLGVRTEAVGLGCGKAEICPTLLKKLLCASVSPSVNAPSLMGDFWWCGRSRSARYGGGPSPILHRTAAGGDVGRAIGADPRQSDAVQPHNHRLCSTELPPVPEQQDQLQPGVRDAAVPRHHVRQHHGGVGAAGSLHQ